MNRIMFNWFMIVAGLVFSASAFHNPLHHDHHGDHRRIRSGIDQVELHDIVNETYSNISAQDQLVTECNVAGAWYNGLGSEFIANVDRETGHITGEYRTGVESTRGAAGTTYAVVSGWTSWDGTHKTVSFSVLWNNGTSTTVWAGLCHVCDGQEVMKTTWLLTSEVDACGDHWLSTRVGQDQFTRREQAPGPRQHLGLDTPSDLRQDRQGN